LRAGIRRRNERRVGSQCAVDMRADQWGRGNTWPEREIVGNRRQRKKNGFWTGTSGGRSTTADTHHPATPLTERRGIREKPIPHNQSRTLTRSSDSGDKLFHEHVDLLRHSARVHATLLSGIRRRWKASGGSCTPDGDGLHVGSTMSLSSTGISSSSGWCDVESVARIQGRSEMGLGCSVRS
jgi:hypothetical protein